MHVLQSLLVSWGNVLHYDIHTSTPTLFLLPMSLTFGACTVRVTVLIVCVCQGQIQSLLPKGGGGGWSKYIVCKARAQNFPTMPMDTKTVPTDAREWQWWPVKNVLALHFGVTSCKLIHFWSLRVMSAQQRGATCILFVSRRGHNMTPWPPPPGSALECMCVTSLHAAKIIAASYIVFSPDSMCTLCTRERIWWYWNDALVVLTQQWCDFYAISGWFYAEQGLVKSSSVLVLNMQSMPTLKIASTITFNRNDVMLVHMTEKSFQWLQPFSLQRVGSGYETTN